MTHLRGPPARFSPAEPLCQDIVSALRCVKTAISDVQNVLLELDEGDLEELAQVGRCCMAFPVLLEGYEAFSSERVG